MFFGLRSDDDTIEERVMGTSLGILWIEVLTRTEPDGEWTCMPGFGDGETIGHVHTVHAVRDVRHTKS